jgi:RNA polymerase sigma-70 factor (ECF subfamily)
LSFEISAFEVKALNISGRIFAIKFSQKTIRKSMIEENRYMRTLVENAHKGKIVAIEELYEINLDRVHTLVSRLAGNKLVAEQLTKNILIRAWQKISEEGPGEQLFSDWLREIAVQLTIDELRDPKLISDKKIKKQLKKDIHNADYSSDPEEKIVAQLDLEHRLIFVLNRIENYNLVEVSNFLGINQSEAETQLSESIEKISEKLSEKNIKRNRKVDWLNLQKVIEPDEEILNSTLVEIKEIRTAKVVEEEEEIEAERKEEIEQVEKAKKKENKEKINLIKDSDEWKKYRPIFYINKKIALLLAIPIIIFLGIHIFLYSGEWSVVIDSGTPVINNNPISSAADLSAGDIIKTDDLSSATIGIINIARINLAGNTTFKRLQDGNSGQLLLGSINIVEYGNEEGLSVEVPEATIENFDQRANYSVKVDKRGNTVVKLKAGRLRVHSSRDVMIFPKHYSIRILKGGGVSIPYYTESESVISSLLDKYLFNGKMGTTLNKILNISTRKESITLWNLLQRVKPKHKNAVYDKLYELVPHPDAIMKSSALNLDQMALQKWLEEIKWTL